MVEICTVLSFIQAFRIIVDVAYYTVKLQISQRNREMMLQAQEQSARSQQQTLETRQVQLFMQLSDTYIEKGYRSTTLEKLSNKWSWVDFDGFMEKYGSETNPEAWNKFQLQLSHLSLQGMLIRDSLLFRREAIQLLGLVPLSL